MTRTYELGFVVEPRQNDDEVQAITDRFTGILEEAGSKITYVDHWGKRKLAYPIRKFQEGKYVFVYVASDNGTPPWPDVERLMMQDERILRFLVVRTDEDLKRAYRKGKVKPPVPGAKAKDDDEAGETVEASGAEETKAEETKAETAAEETQAEETRAEETTAEEPQAEEAKAEAAAEETENTAAEETDAETADKKEGDE